MKNNPYDLSNKKSLLKYLKDSYHPRTEKMQTAYGVIDNPLNKNNKDCQI